MAHTAPANSIGFVILGREDHHSNTTLTSSVRAVAKCRSADAYSHNPKAFMKIFLISIVATAAMAFAPQLQANSGRLSAEHDCKNTTNTLFSSISEAQNKLSKDIHDHLSRSNEYLETETILLVASQIYWYLSEAIFALEAFNFLDTTFKDMSIGKRYQTINAKRLSDACAEFNKTQKYFANVLQESEKMTLIERYKNIFNGMLPIKDCLCTAPYREYNDTPDQDIPPDEATYNTAMNKDYRLLSEAMTLLGDKYLTEDRPPMHAFKLFEAYYSSKVALQLALALELYTVCLHNLNGLSTSEAVLRNELLTRLFVRKEDMRHCLKQITDAFNSLHDSQYDALEKELTGTIERLLIRKIAQDRQPASPAQ